MADAVLRYQAQGETLDAYNRSSKAFRILRGPLGGGKTITTAFTVFEYICNQRPNKMRVRRSRWAVIRNTYPDLTSTTIRDWLAVVPEGAGRMTMGHPPEMKLDFDLPDGTRVMAEVIFIALDKPDDVRKLRGLQLTGAWINEGKEVPKAIFDMLTGRIDRYPAPGTSNWVGILADTNAWDQDHYLQQWALQCADEQNRIALGELDPKDAVMKDYEFFAQPPAVIKVEGKWVVNPLAENLAVLKPDYYARQIAGKKEDWIRVNLANEIGYAYDGKPVHPDYSDVYHCSPTILEPVKGVCRVGLDFGLTPAAAFLQRGPDGRWIVFDEIVTEDASAAELALELHAKIADWNARVPGLTWVFRGDPAGDQEAQGDKNTPFKVLRANQINAFPASTNDPSIRRDALDRPLTRVVAGKPGISISPNCTVIRKGLAGAYCYKRVAIAGETERFRDVPDKNAFSHVCEALEYGLMDGGEHAVVNSPKHSKPQPAVQQRQSWNPLDCSRTQHAVRISRPCRKAAARYRPVRQDWSIPEDGQGGGPRVCSLGQAAERRGCQRFGSAEGQSQHRSRTRRAPDECWR